MEMTLPEDVGEFFDVTTPSDGTNPQEVFEEEGVPVNRRESIMITKIPAGAPFDILVLKYTSTVRTLVRIEFANGPPSNLPVSCIQYTNAGKVE